MAASLAERLQQAAQYCCQQVVECEESAAAAMEFINILATPVPGECIEDMEDLEPEKREHCENLLQLAKALLDPSTNDGQILLERIGWELPQVLVNYNKVSDRCREESAAIIDGLANTSSPRELLVLFMESLNMDASLENVFFCRSIIHGLGIDVVVVYVSVFSRVQKRHIDYFQDISQGLLRVANHGIEQLDELLTISHVSTLAIAKEQPHVQGKDKKMLEEIDDGEIEFIKEYILLAKIIRDGYTKVSLGEEQLQRAQHVLGLFVLQLLGIASSGLKFAVPSPKALSLLVEMAGLLYSCGLSFSTLLAGNQIAYMIYSSQEGGNTESMMEPDDYDQADFDDVQETKRGAALAVYWGLKYEDVAKAFGEHLMLPEKISSGTALIEALNLASTLLVSNTKETSWQLVEKGIFLMQSIIQAQNVAWSKSEADDWSTITVNVMPTLQLVQGVLVTCGKPDLRRRTFSLLERVIKHALPEQARFESLKALISSSPYPSMVSLLLTCLKDEAARAWPAKENPTGGEMEHTLTLSPFVKQEVLDVLENVLEHAGRDILHTPANIDSVLGALNLYRFLLIRETSGSSNYTGVRSNGNLMKARQRWLLPLREALGSLQLSLEKEKKVELLSDMSLALDTLLGVLHRCLELVEESLKESSV